jgi:leucyl aminopeptidase
VKVSATTTPVLSLPADTVAIGVFAGERVAHDTGDGTLQALVDRGEATSGFEHLAVAHTGEQRVLLVGLGDRSRFGADRARAAAAVAHGRAVEIATRTLAWEVPDGVDDAVAGALVEGTVLAAYRFDRYRPPTETARPGAIEALIVSAHDDVVEVVESAAVIATAQNRARELGNRPANDLTPSALAGYARELASTRPALKVTVIDEAEIRSLGMGGFAAVAQGSDQPAKLIRIDYDGAGEREPRLALVGKAVTFDTGGLWLKPSAKMHEMKFDMAGGAAVLESIAALADLRAPVRTMAILGATENMISGGSVKPGDIVTALDGTTIEINNTDAEGRLVLGDCITYARREGADRIVDIATLTGGVVTALGSYYAGLLSNDDEFAGQLLRVGARVGEPLWRLPLHAFYADMVRGRYAQITNLTDRREAQAITAAEFLHHFAGDQLPWAHLDIAGTAYDARSAGITDKGATGFGVRLLVELARTLGPLP